MSIIQRIKKIYESENLEQKEFSVKIGVPTSTFNNMIIRKSDPKYAILKAILDAYPNLSLEWFMTGKGQMWIESPKLDSTTEVCIMAGGCILRRVAIMESDLQKLKES